MVAAGCLKRESRATPAGPSTLRSRDDLHTRSRPLRPHDYRRSGRSGLQAAGDLARALAQLRRRPPVRDRPRDPAPRRSTAASRTSTSRTTTARRTARPRRRSARRCATTCARSATSSSSRRRPATTCGPGRTASGARASTCSRSLDQSLARMGLDYVDIFYSHRFDPETPLEETMGALDTAVRSGRALYAGISSYSPEKTREAAAILERARHAAPDPPALVLAAQPLDRGRAARHARRARRRLHRLLAARAGDADRQVPRRHPAGLARGGEQLALARPADRADAREDPRA